MRIAMQHSRIRFSVLGAAALALVAATPAQADAPVNELVAIAEPVTEANADAGIKSAVKTDAKFRELFASWSSLDTVSPDAMNPMAKPGLQPLVQQPVVAVPSIRPLSAGYVSSGYGMRRHPVLGRRKAHKGIDLAAPTGTPVYATADAIVGKAYYSRSYGKVIYLDHGGDLETRYAHLSGMTVSAGQRVRKGQLIGYVGSTGRSTGPHLHYEVRVDGLAVNPIPYMNGGKGGAALAVSESDTTTQPSANAGLDGRMRPGGQGGL